MSAKYNDEEDNNHSDEIINFKCIRNPSKRYYAMIRRNLSLYYHHAAAALLMVSLVISTTTTTAQPLASDSSQPKGTGGAFDSSTFKSVYDLIQSHPDLRQVSLRFAVCGLLRCASEFISTGFARAPVGIRLSAPIHSLSERSLTEIINFN